MSPRQQPIDCPNDACATPAALGLTACFTNGFGIQIEADGAHTARWDDVHCLVCGHFSTPYAGTRRKGDDLGPDSRWLAALGRTLRQCGHGALSEYLMEKGLGLADLLAMRHRVLGLRSLADMSAMAPGFPQVGLLRVHADLEVPEMFGVAHGEAESEPFARKVRVLGRLLGADEAETSPRHCAPSDPQPGWFFYHTDSFVGLLRLEPNRTYRGTLTIDGCLGRLLRAG
ncbi:MAG TPA: hypothetical protein VNL35_01085 [Chloroflexota bacterium]|nr:hypothetical protein [Chloroflexota bacterium]